VEQLEWDKMEWDKKVASIFQVSPRDGNTDSTFWLKRNDLENQLSRYLSNPGVTVCIDGPTGTGKSSLAITMLKRLNMASTDIQLTKSMKWQDLCKIVFYELHKDGKNKQELAVGIDKGLPTFLVKTTEHNYDFSQFTEHDFAAILKESNSTFVIDDFEKACDEIIVKISEVCKLLTQSYISDKAQLVIIGTDDVYRQLVTKDKSLQERLEELSVGTLKTKYDSWHLLMLGFEKLQIVHPATLYNNNFISKQELDECVDSVFLAANGLPKSLMKFGRKLVWDSWRTNNRQKRVNPADIMKLSLLFPKENYCKYSIKYPKVFETVRDNPVTKCILQYLFDRGIGQIHHSIEIINRLQDEYSRDQIESALSELVSADFITQTGISNDIIFVADPAMAHTLAVVSSDPEKYDADARFIEETGQLKLPFYKLT